jgi:flagellin-like protein
MKRLFKNKKAVSPVIATVMMIMVTMVGMTILFAFVSSYSENYKAGIGSSVMESLIVEDIWLKSGNTVELWIYNVGNIPLNIKAIYVNGLQLDVQSFNGEPIASALNIDKEIPISSQINRHAHVIATCNWERISSSPIIFKIATERGSTFEKSYP